MLKQTYANLAVAVTDEFGENIYLTTEEAKYIIDWLANINGTEDLAMANGDSHPGRLTIEAGEVVIVTINDVVKKPFMLTKGMVENIDTLVESFSRLSNHMFDRVCERAGQTPRPLPDQETKNKKAKGKQGRRYNDRKFKKLGAQLEELVLRNQGISLAKSARHLDISYPTMTKLLRFTPTIVKRRSGLNGRCRLGAGLFIRTAEDVQA